MKSPKTVIESIEIDPSYYTKTKMGFLTRRKRSILFYAILFLIPFCGFSYLGFAVRGAITIEDLLISLPVSLTVFSLIAFFDSARGIEYLTEIDFPKHESEDLSEIDGKTQGRLVRAINKDHDLLEALIFHEEISSKIEDGLGFAKVSDIRSLRNKRDELEAAISEKINFMLKSISLKESKKNPHEVEELLEKGDFHLQKL